MKPVTITRILFICLLIFLNKETEAQPANKKNILGDWIIVGNPVSGKRKNIDPEYSIYNKLGFSFYPNGSFDNKVGYVKHKDSTNRYFGIRSKYRITNKAFYLLDPGRQKWDTCKLIKLTTDTLQFKIRGALATFIHYKSTSQKNPDFDKIILSSSGCMGSCTNMSIMLNNDGTIIFAGGEFTDKKGTYTGKISKERFKLLQADLFITDVRSLKNSYRGGVSDDETISITFVKDGKIYKSINDYGKTAPAQFIWAYNPLRYLYQTLTLKTVSYRDLLPQLNSLKWKKDNKVADLPQSETFLLSYYLNKGKTFDGKFNPRFKLAPSYQLRSPNDVDTDGRYYTFIQNSKSITIDIGFNFYDINAKNWEWRKITEYD